MEKMHLSYAACNMQLPACLWYVLLWVVTYRNELLEPLLEGTLYVSIENYQSFMLSWSFYADAPVDPIQSVLIDIQNRHLKILSAAVQKLVTFLV